MAKFGSNKTRFFPALIFSIATLCAPPVWAAVATVDTDGVKFAEKTSLSTKGAKLILNGVGVRGVSIFRGYAMALYLSERQSDAAAVLALKGAKRIEIVPLIDVPAEEWAKALVRGIEKNHNETELAALKTRTETFRATLLALKTTPKETNLQIDYLPQSGTLLSVNGKRQGEPIKGEDFFRAVLKIWIGERPAAKDLKDALLGKAAPGQPRLVFTQTKPAEGQP